MGKDRKFDFENTWLYKHIFSAIKHPKNFILCLRYPFWKSRNVWTGKFLGYAFTWYDDIPQGWRIAFGEQLSKDIKKAGKKARLRLGKKVPWNELLSWQEIKSKYGALCLYASAADEIFDVIRRYELLSIGYCENCGKPARYVTGGWVMYLCENCKDSINPTDRLTEEDIPDIYTYEENNRVKIDIKEKYNIDFKQLWGLDDEFRSK